MGRLKKIQGSCALIVVCFLAVAVVPLVCEAAAEPANLSGVVNINSATAKELMLLPGIGKITAENIIAYRTQNGNFTTVDDLLKVKGLGKKTLANCVEYIVLKGESTLKKVKK